jgi:imidazole glycerol phosphate synthase glutamine amidotransferase subunit
MITIVDYGMGNLRNVVRGCEAAGEEARVTDNPAEIAEATKLILPGVGAFGEAVKRIDQRGLRQPVLEHVRRGRPLLGICLGMQLLYPESEESPGAAGLGLIPGKVLRFTDAVKVPHIGWNDVESSRPSSLFPASSPSSVMYFVHSFYAPVGPETIAETSYGVKFSAAVASKSVFGVQFHPEKSHEAGKRLLALFAVGGGAP